MKKIIRIIPVLVIIISACNNQNKFVIEGAGATFPFPLYNKMFTEYYQETGIKVEYEAIGSGAGIKKFLGRQIDFGATDAFLSDSDMLKTDIEILHIPICLGAVAISYNLDIADTLNLSPEVLTKIFKGEIKQWDDPRIQQINPDIVLQKEKITVIVRSDASGTTKIFTEYLSRVDDDWAKSIGNGKKINWVVGNETKGNFGVAARINEFVGAIGYLEKIYAQSNNMAIAKIQNKAGNFIYPDPESVSMAANIELPGDTRILLIDPESEHGYPISSFSWLLLYKDLDYFGNRIRAKNTANLVWWMLHEGQNSAEEMGYSPLPVQAIEKAEKLLEELSYDQEKILK